MSLAANISMPSLSAIEPGRKEASSEILAGICTALGLSIVDLLQEVTAEARALAATEAVIVDLTACSAPVTAIASAHELLGSSRSHTAPARSAVALAAA